MPGETPEIVGAPIPAAVTVKLCKLVPVPALVCTDTGPVVAPAGTVATSCVVEAELTDATVPLKRTVLLAGVALKLAPEMVTTVPIGPLSGRKSVTAGTLAAVRRI
jgi:hypothetical protein